MATALTAAELEHWLRFGGTVRVVAASGAAGGGGVVELCECTGEPVERRACEDAEVLARAREAEAEREGPPG